MKQSTLIMLIAAGTLGAYLLSRQRESVIAMPGGAAMPAMPQITMPEITVNIPKGEAAGAGNLEMESYIAQLQAILAQALQGRTQPGAGAGYTAPPGYPMGQPPPGARTVPPTEGNPWGIPPGDVWHYPETGAVGRQGRDKSQNVQNAVSQAQKELDRVTGNVQKLLGQGAQGTNQLPGQVGVVHDYISTLTGPLKGQAQQLAKAYTAGWSPQSAAMSGLFQPQVIAPDLTNVMEKLNAPDLTNVMEKLNIDTGDLPNQLLDAASKAKHQFQVLTLQRRPQSKTETFLRRQPVLKPVVRPIYRLGDFAYKATPNILKPLWFFGF